MIIGTKTPLNDSNVYYNLTTIEYKIQNGDTLWTIATQFNHKNYEKFIYIVKKINNLEDSTLLVDQILILPTNI